MNAQKKAHQNRQSTISKLFVSLVAQSLMIASTQAAPTGGNIVGGSGDITQTGNQTLINQNSNRLAIDWDSFNVDRDERVRFVQPSIDATALNRILDNDPSRILGHINANGRVILMNPNGLIFGGNSRINVQSLVASGLDINADEFMNGDLKFQGVDGASGRVSNHGLIRAATGGNILLLGKTVENGSVIKANLGRVALASGDAAVVTFDDDGMLGVRVDEATLAADVAGTYTTYNRGHIFASGGKILLSASASEDLFSAAVNQGSLSGDIEAISLYDGSFFISGGHGARNKGILDVSAKSGADAGQVMVTGNEVLHQGGIYANAEGEGLAGTIQMEASLTLKLTAGARIGASNDNGTSGALRFEGVTLQPERGATARTSGNTIIARQGSLPRLFTENLLVRMYGPVSQAGPAHVANQFHVANESTAWMLLTHPENDFNQITGELEEINRLDIVDSNDLVLGDIKSTEFQGQTFGNIVSIESLGEGATISQSAETKLSVDVGSFRLAADNIRLGENGSKTEISSIASFSATFQNSIDTNRSISIAQGGGSSISGYHEDTKLLLTHGRNGIDANITMTPTGSVPTRIHVAGMGGGGSSIINGKAEIIVSRNVNASKLAWHVTGPGSRIRQVNELNSSISATNLTMSGDIIELGASTVSAASTLDLTFGSLLHLDGNVGQWAGQVPVYRIQGDGGNNTFIFGENSSPMLGTSIGVFALPTFSIDLGDGDDTAIFNAPMVVGRMSGSTPEEHIIPDAPDGWRDFSIDMGHGDDRIYLNADVYVPITLGQGADYVGDLAPGQYHTLTDFNAGEDVYELISH